MLNWRYIGISSPCKTARWGGSVESIRESVTRLEFGFLKVIDVIGVKKGVEMGLEIIISEIENIWHVKLLPSPDFTNKFFKQNNEISRNITAGSQGIFKFLLKDFI